MTVDASRRLGTPAALDDSPKHHLGDEHRAWLLDRVGATRVRVGGWSTDSAGEEQWVDRWVPASLKELAGWEYIDLGGPRYAAVVVQDIDLPSLTDCMDALSAFPRLPNLWGYSVLTHHVQAIWVLAVPVDLDSERQRDNLASVRVQMAEVLGADPCFTHRSSRNPFAKMVSPYVWFWVHNDRHSISDLRRASYSSNPPLARVRVDTSDRSTDDSPPLEEDLDLDPRGFWRDAEGLIARKRTLFNVLRLHAYELRRAGRETVQPSDLYPIADRLLTDIGRLDHRAPIPPAQVRATVRSVAKWCTNVYRPGVGARRDAEAGALGGRTCQELHAEKVQQQLEDGRRASLRSRLQKAAATELMIRMEKEADPSLTRKQIADRIGCSVSTVSRALNSEAVATTYSSNPPLARVRVNTSDRSTDDSPPITGGSTVHQQETGETHDQERE